MPGLHIPIPNKFNKYIIHFYCLCLSLYHYKDIDLLLSPYSSENFLINYYFFQIIIKLNVQYAINLYFCIINIIEYGQ